MLQLQLYLTSRQTANTIRFGPSELFNFIVAPHQLPNVVLKFANGNSTLEEKIPASPAVGAEFTLFRSKAFALFLRKSGVILLHFCLIFYNFD